MNDEDFNGCYVAYNTPYAIGFYISDRPIKESNQGLRFISDFYKRWIE